MVSWASEIKLRAIRRMGELLKPMAGAQGQRTDLVESHDQVILRPTLSELGVTRDLSSLSQKIATISEEEFETHLNELREQHEEVTVSGVARLVQINERQIKEQKRESERQNNLKKVASLETLPEGVFSTILIDPPWDWSDEAVYGQRVAVLTWQRKLAAIMFTDMVGYTALKKVLLLKA